MVNNPHEERASLLSASLNVHLHFSHQMKPAVFTAWLCSFITGKGPYIEIEIGHLTQMDSSFFQASKYVDNPIIHTVYSH